MRAPIRRVATLVASIALAACSSGTVIVVRPPAPPPPPPRPRIEPLEVTLARPVRGHLLVQTNRPSYVALFEIVPGRGVALLAPSYAHQRTWMLAGLNWVPVSWKVHSTMYYGPPSGTAVPARWVYAIASDEPLRLPDEAFHPSYMRAVLGPVASRGTNPYVTMRAISRAFVPSVVDEAWAEDAYALAATYASDAYRTVRIYCANRTVSEVPEEMADRAWCPVSGTSGGTVVRSTPTRPDSVVAMGGQRMRRRLPETTPVRTPIDRVREPARSENPPMANDRDVPRKDTNKDVKDATKERRGNGNAYGHTDDPKVKGRGIENEKRDDPRHAPPRVDTPVNGKTEKQSEKVEQKAETRQEKQEEKQLRHEEKQEEKAEKIEQKTEVKQEKQQEKQEEKQLRHEEKQEEKAEKVEQKAEKPAVTVDPPREPDAPTTKPEKKEEDRSAKPEEKPESKPEVKADTKEEKSEAKSEEKSEGKPEEKTHGKPDADPPGTKDRKSKP